MKTLPMQSFFLTVLLCLLSSVVWAQEKTISGTVRSDSANTVLPGVSIVVKGADRSASTDDQGRYQITAKESDVLVFSSIGYLSQEVAVAGSSVDVVMIKDVSELSEVVVVGYGTQKKSDVTGAVASVSQSRLENVPNTNFVQAMQASVPGINISQGSANAEGNSATITIRGRNSITAESSPLIVLDEVPYSGSISDINPSDILSINVLKDASSAAIYGSRGANGVILITTKKGTRGKPVISYDGFYGVQNIAELPRMLTPQEFYEYKLTREPESITTSEQAVYDSGIFPDWVDLTTQTGSKMQHTLGINGGNENSRYYISGTYLDSKGVAVNDEFKRISARINVETTIRPWLTIGTNTQLLHSNRDGLPATFSGYTGAHRLNPLTTAFDESGNPAIYPWPQDTYFGNPLAPTLASNLDDSYKVITNNYLNVDLSFIEGLSYRLNTGFEYTTREQKTYYGGNTRRGLLAKGDLSTASSQDKNILIENILNYNREFGDHSIGFTGLLSFQEESLDQSSLAAEGFPNDKLTYYQSNVALSVIPDASFAKETLISQMARLNYSYKSKYLLTLTARRDGFSGFGENNKYGFFPSMAVGWNIGREDFLQDSEVLDELKIRASYGSNGNQAVSAYRTLARLAERSYVDGTTTLPGYVTTTLGTPDLKWETTVAFNLGVDFSFFQGRLQGALDAYSKETIDLLLDRAISSVHGVNSIVQNIGKTGNKGIELGVNSINIKKTDFEWSSTLSFSLNRNQIKDLYGDGRSDTLNQWFIGKPIDVSYGYIYDGVWQLDDDLNSSPQPDTQPGYAKVRDLNGDGKITPGEDKTIIGSREPDFVWGLGNTFKYKRLSLYAFFQGVTGTERRNPIFSDDVQNGVRNNTFYKNYWSPTNPTNDYIANVKNANIYGAGIFESDSYARLKDLSLSYDFPLDLLERLKITRLKVFVNARNLLTITKWSGMDPELSSQESVPLQKEFVFGLNISL